MEKELKRNLANPVTRDWLRAEDELPITSSTTDGDTEKFASNVGGQDSANLKTAIHAIVAQAKDEIKKKNGSALLVCKKYYLKWRGHAWEGRTASRRKRVEKGRYGLFLVRGCQRCRVIEDTDGKKQSATAAVFRIPAYHAKKRERSVRKSARREASHKQCKCGPDSGQRPWECNCCKHLYCPGHDGKGHINRKKADCGHCKAGKWTRRSKSAKSDVIPKPRKALSSCYESLRAGVFFEDESLTKDMANYLLGRYKATSGSVAIQDAQGSANPDSARTELRAEPRASPVATPQEAAASRSAGAVGSAPGPVASESGPEAKRVPRITLGTPLRASGRSRGKTGQFSSFGKRMV